MLKVLGHHHHGGDASCVKASDLNSNGHDDHNHAHGDHDHHHKKRSPHQGHDHAHEDDHADAGSHGHQHEDHDDHLKEHTDSLIKMSVVFVAVYAFYLFEMIAHGIAGQRKAKVDLY